jgi:hypothetical protein
MSYLIRSHSLRPDGPVAKWGEEYKPRANMEFFDCVVEAIEPKDELQIVKPRAVFPEFTKICSMIMQLQDSDELYFFSSGSRSKNE